MSDISKVMDEIKSIRSKCNEIEKLKVSGQNEYRREEEAIDCQKKQLLDSFMSQCDKYNDKYFDSLARSVNELVTLLCRDYNAEWNKTSAPNRNRSQASYEENEKQLYAALDRINSGIEELNKFDFDVAVPPITYSRSGSDEKFTAKTPSGEQKIYDCSAREMTDINDPKPIADIVNDIFPYCKQATACIEALKEDYAKKFNESAFESTVKEQAELWLDNKADEIKAHYDDKYNELFLSDKVNTHYKQFFEGLIADGKEFDVDQQTGASKYNEKLTIGDIKLTAVNTPAHLQHIQASPMLREYMSDGNIASPLIIDLKRCGNILINTDEDNYSDQTVAFVNQLIIQFLLSFPANRINFCLVDIDNKMNFSPFKSLTKINNNILLNGIVRDDRQLENTIKDMEQTMYKIQDDIVSYNNVEDIYEYNKKYDANPQSMHLFVLVNYPTGMRDDLAKRVSKIIDGGNKTGIFTIIINNKNVSLAPGFKKEESDAFINNVAAHALVINRKSGKFTLNMSESNMFVPKKNISVDSLPKIIDMLKESAEINKSKPVDWEEMFAKESEIAKKLKPSESVIDIPIGKRGSETQNLLLKTSGDGSAHAVVIGGTGSGKSNLLHTIILSACYRYSPEELNLYLIDFKGGVEFKFYEANKDRSKQLPHIKLTGLTSDLEDGVAILYNLQKELRRREDEFRKNRVEDIVQYREKGGKIPRLFVIIDEIQELFEQDDKLGQKAIDILRELFKKGRAFGINILWASQNVPKVPGLKDKVLSQIGNRISLRLNNPDDASEVSIDPKAVRNLNRPEKGLGVINDIRYGNDSVEFRVAYAETSENRKKYAQSIIDKWASVTSGVAREPLFIVGDDDEPSPADGVTLYTTSPKASDIVSKSFDSYNLQIGQDYVTGKPYDISLALRENKQNVIMTGLDNDILRDLMGYSALSLIMNQMTNADCVAEGTKIYYANGEMLNPKNSDALFNIVRNDFAFAIENVASPDKLKDCMRDVYKTYKKRSIESSGSEYAKAYTPMFVVIHSLQRYIDLFNENPMLKLADENAEPQKEAAATASPSMSKLDEAMSLFSAAKSMTSSRTAATGGKGNKMPDGVFFVDALKEMLDRGGKEGVHFIISIDNPVGIPSIKNDIAEIAYKVFVKGVNGNVVSQLLSDYKSTNSLSNPQVALVACQDERTKVRVYRYDGARDEKWYKKLCADYAKLKGGKK